MSDLRTRIAAALKTANDRVAGFIGYDEMADAVIRELGLKEERGDKQRPMHVCATPGLHHRYVTDWKSDNE